MDINKYKYLVRYENVFFIVAIIFSLSLPLSESFISIFSGVLLLVSVTFFNINLSNWKDKRIWLLASVFLLYLIGLLATEDLKLGLYELNKNIFWIIIPIGVGLLPRLSSRKFWIIILSFLIAVTVSCSISVIRNLLSSNPELLNFREINYISHISLSFQVAFCILVLIYSIMYRIELFERINPMIRLVWIFCFLFFLIFLKSMLGLFAFYFTLLVVIFYIIRVVDGKTKKIVTSLALISIICIPIIYVGKVAKQFYTIQYTDSSSVEKFTEQGNEYSFDFNDKQKENGFYISWFICTKELYAEWNKRSSVPLTTLNDVGYSVESTLIRYLSSKGLKKDANGIHQLTAEDITNIENGMANYRYAGSVLSIYPRIYETIWEFDRYRLTGDANDQSFSQRIEYAKAAIFIIKEHPFLGIGTGNYKQAYYDAFQKMNTTLSLDNYGTAHNQYLSYLLKFGILGFTYIIGIFVYVFLYKSQKNNVLFIGFLINLVIGNFGESVFETHVGLPFFLFFFSIFVWHSPDNLNE